ncbi:MAG: hypothetical protein ACK4GN_11765 [Runella sp.]
MKKIIFSCLFLIGSLKAFTQDTPTAEAVIDKYLTAIGGKEAIAKIEDLTMNMNMEIDRQGQTMMIETEVKQKKPNKFSSVSYAFGQESGRTICDGSKVYSMRNMRGEQQANTVEGADATLQILQNATFPELLYDMYKITSTVVGKEDVEGKAAWKVEFATPEGKKWQEFFDIDSGLKLKRASEGPGAGGRMGGGTRPEGAAGQRTEGAGGQRGGGMGMMGGGAMNVNLSDYKEIKGTGVKIPYTRTMGGGQFQMKMTVSSVKANKGIKDKEFEIK